MAGSSITVAKIRRIKLKKPIPVYDATSPKLHNFALANGVIVHNTAGRARFKDYQATFPLKGKPLNVAEATQDKINGNMEVASVLAAIGIEPGAADPLKKLRYGKIIFLADADVDGSHINVLLLGLFRKYLPSLFREGMIYITRSPEYIAKHKGKTYFGKTKEAIYKQAKTTNVHITHLKGWGEASEGDLRTIAFDPEHRKLLKVMPPDKSGLKRFDKLVGKDSTYRKQLMGVTDL